MSAGCVHNQLLLQLQLNELYLVFSEYIQIQNLNIYIISEVVLQNQKYIFFP